MATRYQQEIERRAREAETRKLVRVVVADFTKFDAGKAWDPEEIEVIFERRAENSEDCFEICGDAWQEATEYYGAERVEISRTTCGITYYVA